MAVGLKILLAKDFLVVLKLLKLCPSRVMLVHVTRRYERDITHSTEILFKVQEKVIQDEIYQICI